MGWPLSQDYNEAIQSPAATFSDPELKQGEATTNDLGLPMPCSGNFADVYAVKCPQRKFAVKCFTRQIPGLRERYKEISAYLKQTPLPFMVDFSYLEQGIRVRNDWYPILKMQWVEGFALNDFVKKKIDKPQVLDVLSQLWVKLSARLREANMAHCDLQHGNVLLVPGSKEGSLAVKLVDYDGMCVPALTMLKSIEVGHPSFQHPQRAKEGIYSLEVDRFSHIVIYTVLRALMVEGRSLWEKYDNGDNLLFKQSDFEDPGKSAAFQELSKIGDPAVKMLVQTLAESATRPLEKTPLLHELVAKLPAARASGMKTVATSTAEDIFASATAGAGKGREKKKSKAGLMVGGAAALVLVGSVAAFVGMNRTSMNETSTPETKEPETVEAKPDKQEPPDLRIPMKEEPDEPLPATPPVSSKSNEAKAACEKGLKLFHASDNKKAIAALTEAIQHDPNCALAYAYRGWAHARDHLGAAAIADADKALQLASKDDSALLGTAYYVRGHGHRYTGKMDKAIADYTSALQHKPDFAAAYHFRGVAYAAKGDSKRAKADKERAQKLGSGSSK